MALHWPTWCSKCLMFALFAAADTHNKHGSVELPEGDVLIHAGDFTTSGKLSQVEDFVAWFSSQPHPHKILIAGNHGETLLSALNQSLFANWLADGLFCALGFVLLVEGCRSIA